MGKKIFLSYAREDIKKVEAIYLRLEQEGFSPWMDIKNIRGGQLWEPTIKNAIRNSDYILVCLSNKSVNKRGYLQKEIREALEIWEEKLEDDIYLIPLRIEECQVHSLLRNFQWIDYFNEEGWNQLNLSLSQGLITTQLDLVRTATPIKKDFQIHNSFIEISENTELLVVEDYKHSQIVIERLLKKNNFHNITFAQNGLEAVEKANSKLFDLVLMDMQMPVMNGFESISIIRKLESYAEVPIIGLTAFAMKGEIEKVLLAGANDAIAKPIDSLELIEKIYFYLSNKSNRRFFPSLILLAENEKSNSSRLENYLWSAGQKNIVTVNNSTELLNSIIRYKYNAIIIYENILADSNLPLLEITQRLINYNIKIIVIINQNFIISKSKIEHYRKKNIYFEFDTPEKIILLLRNVL